MYIHKNYELEHYEIEYMNMQYEIIWICSWISNYTMYIQLWIHIYEIIHAHTMYISFWISYKIRFTF